jgi:hypothetical protein
MIFSVFSIAHVARYRFIDLILFVALNPILVTIFLEEYLEKSNYIGSVQRGRLKKLKKS